MKGRLIYGVFLLACVLMLCSGCIAGESEAERVKSGDTVLVHYTGTLENGTVFDSSAGREPLRFTVGKGEVIPGFDEGVVGMQVGEEKTLQIPVDRGVRAIPRGPHLLPRPCRDRRRGEPDGR